MSSIVNIAGMTGIRIGTDKYHISSDKIRGIQEAESKKEVRSIWGIIKDWFFSTHREEAKQALFDLCNGANNQVKLQAFSKLEQLSAPGFKKQFFIDIDPYQKELMLCIDNALTVQLRREDYPPDTYQLMERIGPVDHFTVEGQLDLIKIDIARAQYTFCTPEKTIAYRNDDGIPKEDKLAFVDNIKGTDYQKKMLGILISQAICADMQTCRSKDGFIAFGYTGLPFEQHSTVTTFRDGTMKVDVHYKIENDEVHFEKLNAGDKIFRKMCMDASFLIWSHEDKTELLYADWQGTGLYVKPAATVAVTN